MVISDLSVGGVYIIATLVALVTTGVLYGNREKTAALPLSLAGASAAVWSFGLFLSTLPAESVALVGIRIVYIGVGVGLPAAFVFALDYTGREQYLTPTVFGLLSIHPILLSVFVVFNPGELFFTGLDPAAPLGVDQQWGPAFWVHSAYGYLLVLITSLLVLDLLVRTNRVLYRGQALLLAAGLFIPLPLNAIFLSGLVSFDTTPLGLVLMCALFAGAIVAYRFVDISPIAREKVINNVRDGMAVVDTDDRIVEINPAGREMLNVESSIVGSSVDEALDFPESKAAYEALTATTDTSSQTVELGDLYYSIEATPIHDGRERHVGWLFLLQNVTEQRRRERELEGQIEKLDQFATLVSHDLRNPISIINGYIEQTRLTDDLQYLDNVERATERMEEIIDDVLELAREGQEVTVPEPVVVETIAREAWNHTKTHGASLSVASETEINADPQRLTRLFENLFRNAIEHGTPETSAPTALTVTVGIADETSTTVTVYVADNGVGIPEADRDRVLKGGYTTGDDGTGLGLAIVSQITDAHGWQMTVTDSTSGGACFEISRISKPW